MCINQQSGCFSNILYCIKIIAQNLLKKGMFKKKIKESEDAQSMDNSSINSQDNHSKSFMLGGGKKFVNIIMPDIEIKKKQQYKKQPYCIICFRNFTAIFRQHHCRICANAVCGQCSKSMINKERACDLCIMQCSNSHEEKKKKEMLLTLQTLCAFLVYRKNIKMAEFQKLKSGVSEDQEELTKELKGQDKQIKELQTQNQILKDERLKLEAQLQKIRQANAQVESEIIELEKQVGSIDN